MTPQLSGVLTALAIPSRPTARIDESTLRRLIHHSIDAGVDGAVAAG